MATDPICGMTVNPQSAAGNYVHNGERYYFCSQHCLAKFKEDPEKFLESRAAGHVCTVIGALHTMHGPSASSKRSRRAESFMSVRWIPKCASPNRARARSAAWRLEPASPAAPSVKTEYVCPMHPEIVRAEPGACPICGMALEPRTVTLEEEANPELIDMTRRFWVGVVLSLPVAFLAMSEMIPGQPLQRSFSPRLLNWVQFYSPRRWCSGAAGRFFSAAGRPSSTAVSTCSRSSPSVWARRTFTVWWRRFFPTSFRHRSAVTAVKSPCTSMPRR